PETPRPPGLAVVLVPRLVHIDRVLERQQDLEFLAGFLERGADLAEDLAQLATRDRHADDIAEVGPDRRERGMADALEVGDLGRQVRADQATLLDVRRHRGPKSPRAGVAPVLGTGVLLDG